MFPEPNYNDMIVPFQLATSGLRGRFVRLGATLDEILGKHQYPAPVARLVAEAATLACVLGSMLKHEGIFSLQARGDGPVSLLVADYRSDGSLRAYASFNKDKLVGPAAVNAGVPDSFAELLGAGYLAFTVDRGGDFEPYQGIVEIEGDSLTVAARHYFQQSEQIQTELSFFTAPIILSFHTAVLCLQAMPPEQLSEAHDLDTLPPGWDEATALMHTLTAAEALDGTLHPHDVLFRLFHEGGVKAYDTVHVMHRCRCGLERAERVLAMLTEADAQELSDHGRVEVRCEFCNSTYNFTLDELAELRRKLANKM